MGSWITEKQLAVIAKAVAIIAVVLLHVLSFFPDSIYFDLPYKHFVIFLNQALRFNVPLFLALSGFGLTRKYQQKSLTKKDFLWGRAKKLLPLYCLWSIILFALLYLSRTWSSGVEGGFFQSLIFGQADYHLYFIFLIFQFYFLFSGLMSDKADSQQLKRLVIISGTVQIAWFLLLRFLVLNQTLVGQYLSSDQVQYRLVINWMFYFIFGIFLARVKLKLSQRDRFLALILVLICLISLFWSVYDSHQLLAQTQNVVFATSFIRLPVFIYATSFISAIVIYGQFLFSKKNLLIRVLSKIGQYSYLIYLSHTLVLRIVEGIITTGPRPFTLARASLVLLLGVAVSVLEVS